MEYDYAKHGKEFQIDITGEAKVGDIINGKMLLRLVHENKTNRIVTKTSSLNYKEYEEIEPVTHQTWVVRYSDDWVNKNKDFIELFEKQNYATNIVYW